MNVRIAKYVVILVITLGSLGLLKTSFSFVQPVSAATQCVGSCCVTCSNSLCTKIITADPCNTTCEVPNNCGGSMSCSACPANTPPPPPGSGWGGCGSCNCNIGNSPAECRTCPSGCCWDPGGCAPPPCNSTAPGAPLLSSPANNSTVIIGSGVKFVWNAPSWGNECGGTSRYYNLYYREFLNGTCSGPVTATGNLAGTAVNRTDILPNKTYCWYVKATNGASKSTYSTTWKFSTLPDPDITNYSVDNPNLCNGSNISGRTDNPKANNPIKIVMRVQDTTSDFANGINNFQTLNVIVLPQSVQNSTYASQTVIEPQGVPYLGFQATNLNSGTISFASLDNGTVPRYGATSTSGNLGNGAGTATLLGLNTANGTKVVKVSNNELEITWQIRFENTYATAPLNVYLMATANIAGTVVSQDSDTLGNVLLRYTKTGTWQTDMQSPTAIVGNPSVTGPGTFTVKWTGNDTSTGNTGITTYGSYCYVNGSSGMVLTDTTLVQNINLPNSAVGYPSPSNCLITAANQGNHGYSLNTNGGSGTVNFKLHVEDGACNPSESTQGLDNLKAWIITADGLTHATGGFNGFVIQNVPNLQGIVPNLDDDAYLSTYSLISGNTQIVGGRQSKNNYYVTSYTNLGKDPPPISGQTNWFDYLYKLASASTAVQAKNLTTMGGSISGALGISSASEGYFVVNGSLTVNSGAVCDAKVGIFVTGNLTINPSLTRYPGNGCVFIVKGDITIGTGTRKTASGLPAGSYAAYDEVHAFLVTNGKFSTTLDSFGATEIPDGLYVHGGVVAKTIDLKRDLGTTQNPGQPAEVFDYDPYYANDFRNIFASNSFSIRSQ